MDQSNKMIELHSSEIAELRSLLRADGTLDDTEVQRRSWTQATLDDKVIFDDDAVRLAKAFQLQKADTFFVVRIIDLLSSTDCIRAYRFSSTAEAVEAFQGPEYYDFNLDDCLLFSWPLSCAVLRPGSVDTTFFVGSESFVHTATLA